MSAHSSTANAAAIAAGWPPTRRPVRVAPAQVRTLQPPTRDRIRQVPAVHSLADRLRAVVRRRWHEAQRAAAMQVPAGTVKRGRA
ncbi:hypothetical protein OEIGOIKO_03135 [Streptomyces chrestomyceticus JCM 4735]|uniref:Uncharacterized protein n=1 Tax=Streptomyces chrestomyceticus JCM 4735 TaxID=1306181 RepID=A0A7U9PWK5_9ACTN|nr:hypothetical protein [Streptomyces chrestomyceticus]GCD35392.1 hypothetical protein OEIGOIKO_03135 [Streptomyces chrestomyceticus JCM 4735]